jgi:hypothetical protein
LRCSPIKNYFFGGSQPELLRLIDYRSIRPQIIVSAQNSLDVNRRARGGIGICRTRCEYTERPVMFSVLCYAIDRYFLDVMTARLLSHF